MRLSKYTHALVWMLLSFGVTPVFCATTLNSQDNQDTNQDILQSPLWSYLKDQYFQQIGSITFNHDIKVYAPDYAENPMQVPVSVDASKLGKVKTLIVLADLNPIQKILEYQPGEMFDAQVSFYFKIQQRSPVRVLAQLEDGSWHMNGKWIEALGGGCTVPSLKYAQLDWNKIGQISGMIVSLPLQGKKLKLSVIHPMDTGLVSGIPEFYIQSLAFTTQGDNKQSAELFLYQPISQDPALSLTIKKAFAQAPIDMSLRDSNGQIFRTSTEQLQLRSAEHRVPSLLLHQ